MGQTVAVGGINANLSPDAFHQWAADFLKCFDGYEQPSRFSPVPFFLLGRAIELELKSRHLAKMTRTEVKDQFGHKLIAAYRALPADQQLLTAEEVCELDAASEMYNSKSFEYFFPEHALTAYRKFPKLELLTSIARKLIAR